jgi:alpha-mannosidase
MTRLFLFTITFLITGNLFSQVQVTTERGDGSWNFTSISRPSRSDAAHYSKITISGNKPLASCLSPDGMHNGVLPQENRLLRDFFCFTNTAKGGKIVMDLCKVIPVTMINSYSAHGPVGGTTWCNEFDGSRGPQVYTLYASSSRQPDFDNLSGKEWIKIADVDTRPGNDKEDWQGTYGVNVTNADGSLLGNFRWIVWDVKPTFKKGTRPEWTNTWYCELDVHSPETMKNAGDAIMAGTQLEEIILVFKSHFDIGFTHPAPEIVNIYRTSMIDNALNLIEESNKLPPEKRFVWTIPSWVAYQILWDGQDSIRRSKIIKAMKNGRLVVHGLPVTLQTESLEPEDLIFGLSLNKKVSNEVGIPMSRSGKMTDVPSHSWILPTLLKNAGIDFLHIGVNPCNERPAVPLLYYWQGPDGSKLLTMQTQGYGSDCEFGHGLYPPKDWPYKTWLALIVSTDNAGPPEKNEVEYLLNEAAKNEPGVKIRFGKMEDFSDAIFAEEKQGAKIPVIRADMPDSWIHGMGTMPVEESIAHKTRKEITSVEILDSHLRLWGLSRTDISKDLFTAHERSLMYGEHTWGGARNLQGRNAYGIKDFEDFIKTDKDCQWLENTWKDHANYIRKSAEISDSLAMQEMALLAANVAVEGKRMVVYNSLPWKRNALVEIPDSKGRKILVKNISACGYKTISLKDYTDIDKVELKEEATLENKFLKIKVSRKSGGIVSIIEKKSGRELVDTQSKYAFGQYLYERFDKEQNQIYHLGCSHLNTVYGSNGRCCSGWNIRADLPLTPPYQSAVPEFQSLQISKTNTTSEAILTAGAAGIIQSDITTTISLPDDLPWFDIKVQLNNKKPDYWPESGSIYLPVSANNPQFRIGRLGAVVDPSKDFASGSNRTYGYVNTGAMIADQQEKGLAFCPLDQGLMSFGDKGICTIDPDYVPTKPLALVSMFNNIWTINFPYWIKGSLSSRVRIWAIENLKDSSLVIAATEARYPVLVGNAEGQAGKFPATVTGIEFSRKGIVLVSFISNPDGNGSLMRLWEQCGTSGNLIVRFPEGSKFIKATPVNLRGEIEGKPIPVSARKLNLFLKAYSPSSYILE